MNLDEQRFLAELTNALEKTHDWLDNIYDVDTRADGTHRESPSGGGKILGLLHRVLANAQARGVTNK